MMIRLLVRGAFAQGIGVRPAAPVVVVGRCKREPVGEPERLTAGRRDMTGSLSRSAAPSFLAMILALIRQFEIHSPARGWRLWPRTRRYRSISITVRCLARPMRRCDPLGMSR